MKPRSEKGLVGGRRGNVYFGFWILDFGLPHQPRVTGDRQLITFNPKSKIRNPKSFPRRGGILFEVLLSFALFMGAAAFTLTAVRSVLGSLDRVSMKQEAVDLVKSKLAELEAGLITLADLRDGASADETDHWVFDVRTSRTEFTNLTLVELTVRQTQSPSSSQSEDDLFSFTLRQLIVLREVDAQPFERDQMSEVGGE